MANIAGFNAAAQGEMQNFDAIPAQKAVMMISESEMKPTKDGKGQRLVLVASLIGEGQYKGRKIFIGLNLSNSNKQAEDIAARELAAICKSVGVITPQDSVELHNKPFIGDIGVKPRKDQGKNVIPGEFENFMKGYEPVGNSAQMAGHAAIENNTAHHTAAAGSPPTQAPTPAAPPWAKK